MRTRSKLLHVIARSKATGQSASPAGKPDKLAAVWVNSLDIAYSPKVLLAVMLRCKENGLPRRFAPRNDMQKLVRCQRLQERPARANPQPVTYLPEVLLIVLCYCGDADCHTSSPQSPPCRRPKVRHAQLRPKARAGQRSLGSPFPTKRAALRGPVVMPAEGQRGSNAPLALLSPQRVPLCGGPSTGSQ